MQPLTTTANAPDDIDAVLGRFQAWAASRKPAAKSSYKNLPDGVRELSYQEALESSRNRWQARIRSSGREESGSEAPATTAELGPPQTSEDAAFPRDKLALSGVPDTLSGSSAHISEAPHKPRFNAVLAEALPAEPDPDALALVWPVSPKSERQVSMSLRVAASEQALIKARAAEAGLSVSAYLRQCALEVEKLRAQVHNTLALLEHGSQPVRSFTVGPSQTPATTVGFFARLCQRLFGGPARLTLRA